MRIGNVIRTNITAVVGLLIFSLSWLMSDSSSVVLISAAIIIITCFGLHGVDYLHPGYAYLITWASVLVFSTLGLSDHSRSLSIDTVRVLLPIILMWLIGTAGNPKRQKPIPEQFSRGGRLTVYLGFAVMYAMAFVNVAVAGYVPLLSLITTGDSGYLEFGIPSVFGAYLAFANALGCLALYLYYSRKQPVYLWLFLSVLVIHVAFITRQNLVTLLVEAFVIRCFMVGRPRFSKVAVSCALALLAFSAIGQFRSGDIREIIVVSEDFAWVPTSTVWLYAYSYFNVMNLENMMVGSDAPYFDGTMWSSLLPSFFRPLDEHETFLELSNMNVSSYIYPVFQDIGALGSVAFTFVAGWLTISAYRHARTFFGIATYACLFFCALFSFFVNFWLYLPVIAQVFFFKAFDIALFTKVRAVTASGDK